MKFFTPSNKHKKAGISLLLAIVGSTIALSIALAILSTITRSVEQSQNLERSTQVFFAIESGLEAGFFHHNARGQGVKFLELNDGSFPAAQIINHDSTNIDTSWTIDGRSDSHVIEGLIYEDTPLQLRWFWDNSDTVDDNPATNQEDNVPNFNMSFDPDNDVPGQSDLNFGADEDGPLLSWILTRSTATGVGSLVPSADDPENPCDLPTSFICRDRLSSSLASNDASRNNTLLPRTQTETTSTIFDFLNVAGGSKFQLIVTPTRPFVDSWTGQKIDGIPFQLTGVSGQNLPLPEYEIHTMVSTHGFSKELELSNIPEQTAIQAFSYSLFD